MQFKKLKTEPYFWVTCPMTVLMALAALVWFLPAARATEPVVTNVRAEQNAGTKFVAIHYDLSGSTSPVFVSLQISSDAGTTFAIPASTLSGAVGVGIPIGKNKLITWNAGVDWNNQLSNTIRFRVTAIDALPAAPVLISPLHNSTKIYNAPAHPRHTFTWQAVEGADSYRLVVKRFGNVVVDQVVNGLTFTPDMDLYTVTWQVYAIKQGFQGPSSPVWTAKVIVYL